MKKSKSGNPVCVFCGRSGNGVQFAIFNPRFQPFGTACTECESSLPEGTTIPAPAPVPVAPVKPAFTMADANHCYAVPGENHIVDVQNPITGKSWHSGETFEQIKLRYPGAELMTLEAYTTAKAGRQQTPIVWQQITEELYWQWLEVLPPAFHSGGAFMVGEPDDHCVQTGSPRYQGCFKKGDKYFAASRPMTIKEFRAAMDATFSALNSARVMNAEAFA